MGMFTELSILYAKYRPEKREFPSLPLPDVESRSLTISVSMFLSFSHGAPQALLEQDQPSQGHPSCRTGSPLVRACLPLHQIRFVLLSSTFPLLERLADFRLTLSSDEFDNAALAMMERSADAYEHNQFKDTIVRVANIEIYYKVRFSFPRLVASRAELTSLPFFRSPGPHLLPLGAAHSPHRSSRRPHSQDRSRSSRSNVPEEGQR